MTEPIKKFGDAALARRVVEEFANQLPGDQGEAVSFIRHDQCNALGMSEEDCNLLYMAVKPTDDRIIDDSSTGYEAPGLSEKGLIITPMEQRWLGLRFSKEFVRAFAGPDGKQVLLASIQALKEGKIIKLLNNPLHYTSGLMSALRSVGVDPRSLIPYIVDAGTKGGTGQKLVAIDIIGEIEKDPLARFYYYGKICSGSEAGLKGLSLALQSPDQAQRDSANVALQKIGRLAKSLAPMAIKQYHKLSKAKADSSEIAQILETISVIAEPTTEVLDFFAKLAAKDYFHIDLLGRLGPEALPVLLHIVRSEDYATRQEAFRTIFSMDFAQTIPFLFSDPQHRDFDIQDARLRALRVIAYNEIQVPSVDNQIKLAAMLNDPSAEMRVAAAAAIGVQGESAKLILPLLVSMRENDREQEATRQAAAKAIKAIEEQVL